ncbi:MAG: hypothetical protein HYV04_03980 [Deltaproteobacteria bacterium]|nr:hypothetical protein [Deltaproteobacteria bacterium]
MQFRVLLLALAVVAFGLLVPTVADACAVCLTGASGGDRMADAYGWSVLFLMGMPYAILGSVAGWIFYVHRRASKERSTVKDKARVYHLASIQKESEG